ncbi:MAG TPA: DUF4037 domain-containing protein [Anaerolineales bacterium]|nr:DUF4037 domain-containing protein [Anaerolineales bacterium]
MPDFIPGLRLGQLFYYEAVQPILDRTFPDLQYSAALIGTGSEILGFDTEMSRDHDWGPRLMLFLREDDLAQHRQAIDEALRNGLPPRFHGYSTNFSPPDPDDNNVQALQEIEASPVNHHVEILTLRGYFLDYLGFDIETPIEPADWLTFSEQKLRTIVGGAVYHDGIGLEAVRDRFSYYPDDVWLYLLASGWDRIGEEEHLMGRAGLVGDEIGSALIGARLVRHVMRLGFLMEKQYAPYPKWFGTAFLKLQCGGDLSPVLRKTLLAETWQEREKYLVPAYEHIAGVHNRLGITESLPAKARNFFGRPFQVIDGGAFAEAIRARIMDPVVSQLAAGNRIGSIDQISDHTDILANPEWRKTLRQLYE